MKARKKIPSIKKEIKDFLLSEEGKISKKDIAKIGMSVAVLSMLFAPDSAQAGHSSTSRHTNGPSAVHASGTFDDMFGNGHDSAHPHGSHNSHHSHWDI